MKVITIGSKVIDDAIIFCGAEKNIKSVNRITNISPFALCFNSGKKVIGDLSYISKDSYVSYVQRVELSGQLEISEDFDAVVIDMADVRLPFYEVTYDSKETVRITGNNFNAGILEKLQNNAEKQQIHIKKVNPMQCTQEELKALLMEYAQWLQTTFKEKKVILECNHNAYQSLSENGKFEVSAQITALVKYNDFYDRCVDIFKDMLECHIIPAPSYICSDKKDNDFFSSNRFYYEYLADSLCDIMHGAYDAPKRLYEYQYAMQRYCEKCILGKLVENINLRRMGRNIVMIGGTKELENELQECTGSIVCGRINIQAEDSQETIRDGMSMFDKSLHLFVVVSLVANKHILRQLKDIGADYEKDIVTIEPETVMLAGFMGRYEDIFGNYIEVKGISDIEISGCGNYISIGLNSPTNRFYISVGDDNKIVIADYAQLWLNKEIKMKGIAASEISIVGGCHIANNLKIDAGKFGTVIIRKACLISYDVLMHCGNGFAEKSGVEDSIVLEEWVWLGYRTTLLAGAHVNSGCIVGARALVAEEIPNNCMAAGDPARIIKRNVTWHQDIMEKSISVVPEQYRKFTGE